MENWLKLWFFNSIRKTFQLFESIKQGMLEPFWNVYFDFRSRDNKLIYILLQLFAIFFVKVQKFWECYKNLKKSPTLFYLALLYDF